MEIYRLYHVVTTFSNVGSMLLTFATLVQCFYNDYNIGTTLLQHVNADRG